MSAAFAELKDFYAGEAEATLALEDPIPRLYYILFYGATRPPSTHRGQPSMYEEYVVEAEKPELAAFRMHAHIVLNTIKKVRIENPTSPVLASFSDAEKYVLRPLLRADALTRRWTMAEFNLLRFDTFVYFRELRRDSSNDHIAQFMPYERLELYDWCAQVIDAYKTARSNLIDAYIKMRVHKFLTAKFRDVLEVSSAPQSAVLLDLEESIEDIIDINTDPNAFAYYCMAPPQALTREEHAEDEGDATISPSLKLTEWGASISQLPNYTLRSLFSHAKQLARGELRITDLMKAPEHALFRQQALTALYSSTYDGPVPRVSPLDVKTWNVTEERRYLTGADLMCRFGIDNGHGRRYTAKPDSVFQTFLDETCRVSRLENALLVMHSFDENIRANMIKFFWDMHWVERHFRNTKIAEIVNTAWRLAAYGNESPGFFGGAEEDMSVHETTVLLVPLHSSRSPNVLLTEDNFSLDVEDQLLPLLERVFQPISDAPVPRLVTPLTADRSRLVLFANNPWFRARTERPTPESKYSAKLVAGSRMGLLVHEKISKISTPISVDVWTPRFDDSTKMIPGEVIRGEVSITRVMQKAQRQPALSYTQFSYSPQKRLNPSDYALCAAFRELSQRPRNRLALFHPPIIGSSGGIHATFWKITMLREGFHYQTCGEMDYHVFVKYLTTTLADAGIYVLSRRTSSVLLLELAYAKKVAENVPGAPFEILQVVTNLEQVSMNAKLSKTPHTRDLEKDVACARALQHFRFEIWNTFANEHMELDEWYASLDLCQEVKVDPLLDDYPQQWDTSAERGDYVQRLLEPFAPIKPPDQRRAYFRLLDKRQSPEFAKFWQLFRALFEMKRRQYDRTPERVWDPTRTSGGILVSARRLEEIGFTNTSHAFYLHALDAQKPVLRPVLIYNQEFNLPHVLSQLERIAAVIPPTVSSQPEFLPRALENGLIGMDNFVQRLIAETKNSSDKEFLEQHVSEAARKTAVIHETPKGKVVVPAPDESFEKLISGRQETKIRVFRSQVSCDRRFSRPLNPGIGYETDVENAAMTKTERLALFETRFKERAKRFFAAENLVRLLDYIMFVQRSWSYAYSWQESDEKTRTSKNSAEDIARLLRRGGILNNFMCAYFLGPDYEGIQKKRFRALLERFDGPLADDSYKLNHTFPKHNALMLRRKQTDTLDSDAYSVLGLPGPAQEFYVDCCYFRDRPVSIVQLSKRALALNTVDSVRERAMKAFLAVAEHFATIRELGAKFLDGANKVDIQNFRKRIGELWLTYSQTTTQADVLQKALQKELQQMTDALYQQAFLLTTEVTVLRDVSTLLHEVIAVGIRIVQQNRGGDQMKKEEEQLLTLASLSARFRTQVQKNKYEVKESRKLVESIIQENMARLEKMRQGIVVSDVMDLENASTQELKSESRQAAAANEKTSASRVAKHENANNNSPIIPQSNVFAMKQNQPAALQMDVETWL
jgi:hypothetical protein